ncbi:hypothetical protein ABIB60_000938 [Hymenobacter sp. UYP22]
MVSLMFNLRKWCKQNIKLTISLFHYFTFPPLILFREKTLRLA